MATVTYNLLPTEALVAEAAPVSPLYPKVGKNQKAVEVGANLPIKNEKIEVEKVNSKTSKYLYLHNVKCQSFLLSELTLNVTIPPYLPQQSRVRIMGCLLLLLKFPTGGSLGGELLEFPICRSPRGKIFWEGTVVANNQDRAVFVVNNNLVTFMGVMSQAGNVYQGFHPRVDFLLLVYIFSKPSRR